MKWIKLAFRVFQSNFERLPMPYRLFLVVTKSCNSRCLHCKIWQETPQNELTLDEIDKISKGMPYLQWLNVSGGETTERSDLVDICAAFVKNCPDLIFLNFATNGLNPDHIEDQVRKISKLKIPYFQVNISIDGPEKINDVLRGIDGDFKLAVETYRRLKKIEGVRTQVGLTLFHKNVNQVDQMIREIQTIIPEFTHDDLHINIPHLSPHYYGNSKMKPLTPEGTIAAIENLHDKQKVRFTPVAIIEWIYRRNIRKYLETSKTPMRCAALLSSVYVSEHGDVYPCTIWDKSIGSLRQTDYQLEPIIKSELGRMTRAEIRKSNCPNCWTPCEAYQTIGANGLRIFNGPD